MLPTFESNLPAQEVFADVETFIAELGYQVISKDFTRPWGGFFVLDESQAAKFAAQFFPNLSMESIQITNKLSPKFLVVAPENAFPGNTILEEQKSGRSFLGPWASPSQIQTNKARWDPMFLGISLNSNKAKDTD